MNNEFLVGFARQRGYWVQEAEGSAPNDGEIVLCELKYSGLKPPVPVGYPSSCGIFSFFIFHFSLFLDMFGAEASASLAYNRHRSTMRFRIVVRNDEPSIIIVKSEPSSSRSDSHPEAIVIQKRQSS